MQPVHGPTTHLRPALAARRRAWIARVLSAAIALKALPTRGHVAVPQPLRFPLDHGSHPDTRIEWWYLTGALRSGNGRAFGFQLTFFRTRVDAAAALRSAFAARELIMAHAAITDVQAARHVHGHAIARAGFGVAGAAVGDTQLQLRRWSLRREASSGAYHARASTPSWAIDLVAAPTQALLLQGEQGWSTKAPGGQHASHYYSQPQLQVRGTLRVDEQTRVDVTGQAWLDHEWSQALMHPEAVGWDWIGINLDDGAALTAFRLRRQDGSVLWSGGSWRAAPKDRSRPQPVLNFPPDAVRFMPGRRWRSPATQALYPVVWQVSTPVGAFAVEPALDAQEIDARTSTGLVYWEGLVSLHDLQGRRLGSGYLEMTGYTAPLRF